MTFGDICALGPALSAFLGEFASCFCTRASLSRLKDYVTGQLSDLPRKSVEPIALMLGLAPRTLQEFLSHAVWNVDRLRDTAQRLVARDHADVQAIGIIDESGHPKKGDKTACVQRQYCGAVGKVENCVMSVHLCYSSFDGKFRTMLDSDLYLPENGWDADRRKKADIPDSAAYRGKHEIGLEQLRRAADNGVHLPWIVADEWYGGKHSFIKGLEDLGRRFVLEMPKHMTGWMRPPADPRTGRSQVQDLVRWSRPMLYQEWTEFHVKDTQAGPMVVEVRAAPIWMLLDDQVVGPWWVIATRNRVDGQPVKYFLSNASAGVPLEVLLHVAYSRWAVERCLEDEKSELGLSHFEVRGYGAVLRHLRITQVSHLFLARQTERLAEKKSGGDDLPSARREPRVACGVAAQHGRSAADFGRGR